mmetsp:Transcript_14382/g.43462  ORF Transcript_14382/g.43462 Transcript_14382/m.43462 type:complete len:230 (-) Transcript_14382:332-1021(-)
MQKVWRRVSNYLKNDLREIVAPSSLPNPPGWKDNSPPPRTWAENWTLFKQGIRAYGDTWRPKKPEKEDDETVAESPEAKQLKEDFAYIARGGAEGVRPYLQRLYAARVATMQAAGREFVDGYRDGLEKAQADTLIESMADKFWNKSNSGSEQPPSHSQPQQPAAEQPPGAHPSEPLNGPGHSSADAVQQNAAGGVHSSPPGQPSTQEVAGTGPLAQPSRYAGTEGTQTP